MTKWRAIIAQDFTFENVARVAQATADFWKSEIQNPKSKVYGREPKVVIGYDRRFFSDRFAQITAEVFAGNDYRHPYARTDAHAERFVCSEKSRGGRGRDD